MGKRLASQRTAPVLLDQLDAWLGIWEVVGTEPGVGMELTDLLTKQTRFVYERTASRSLVRRDTVLGRVVDSDGIAFIAGLFPRALGPSDAEFIAKQIRRACHVRTRPVARELLREPDMQRMIIDGWRRAVDARSKPPTLTNTDGDPFIMTTDRFDIAGSRQELLARLASFSGASEPESETDPNEVVFVITKRDTRTDRSRDNTIIGRVVVRDRSMLVETNSLERANRLRQALHAHLGGLIHFRLRDETGADQLFARAASKASKPSSSAARQPKRDPELVAMERQLREEYMDRWMDEPVPMLSGLTPRAAASKSAASRRSLEVLLKDFEQHEARLPANERIDIERLRRELFDAEPRRR